MDIIGELARNPALLTFTFILFFLAVASLAVLGYSVKLSNKGFSMTRNIEQRIRQITIKEIFGQLKGTFQLMVDASFKSGMNASRLMDRDLIDAEMGKSIELIDTLRDEFSETCRTLVKRFSTPEFSVDDMKILDNVFANFSYKFLRTLESKYRRQNWQPMTQLEFEEAIDQATLAILKDYHNSVSSFYPAKRCAVPQDEVYQLFDDPEECKDGNPLRELLKFTIHSCFVAARRLKNDAEKKLAEERAYLEQQLAKLASSDAVVSAQNDVQGGKL